MGTAMAEIQRGRAYSHWIHVDVNNKNNNNNNQIYDPQNQQRKTAGTIEKPSCRK